MNARELRDSWRDATLNGRFCGNISVLVDGASISTILRALDLLAGVEESADGIVRELLDEADLCRNETATDIADLLEEAASCIVAMASQFKANHAALVALRQENARLRGHAEAIKAAFFRSWAGDMSEDEFNELPCIAAYRADSPKEAK